MKKCILIIVILVCCGWVAAQCSKSSSSNEGGNRKSLFGITCGPTIDWFVPTSKPLNYKQEKAGFITGIVADFNVASKEFLYFSTGLMIRYLQGEVALTKQYNFNINEFEINDTINTTRNYQTTYLTIPTGIKLRFTASDKLVFLGKFGLYHNFRIAGKQYDSFSLSGDDDDYSITTKKKYNKDASLFAESGYAGLGLEYIFQNSLRIFINFDYSCQFNYFKFKDISISEDSSARFKAIIHSMHINLGILF
jgi:hypothetical protein